MKKILILSFLLTSLNFCFGQTQADMNKAEHEKYLKADKELNAVYQRVLKEYKKDTAFIKNLITSQKIWIQFRNAEMKLKYPDREPGYYGSVQPMCWSIYLTELTNERIKSLKVWIDGIEEGDVCSGSVKTSSKILRRAMADPEYILIGTNSNLVLSIDTITLTRTTTK